MDAGAGSIKLLFCILLIIASAFFSGAEIAYARVNKIKLKSIAEDGNQKGKRALHIVNRLDRALIAILIGNTVVNLSCAVLAASAVMDLWGEGHVVFAAVVAAVVIFLLGEVVPKAFSNANSEKVALAYSGILAVLIKVLAPITFVFSKISDLIAKLCGGEQDEGMTEEELEIIIDTVEESGSLDEEQTDLLQNAVDFTKTTVESVMTMREDICGVDVKASPSEVLAIVKNTGFSRLPVYSGDIDHVIGVLSVREYLRAYLHRETVNLRRVMMAPKFASPDAAIDDLFHEMSAGKQQFLIVREGKTTVGIATIEDFLEELVGEIWDEYDEYDENFIKLGGNYFEISPKMKVRDALMRIGYEAALSPDVKNKTLEAWLRANMGDSVLEKDRGFVFQRLAVMAGELEDGNTLSGVIIRLCDSEEEAKEELEK